MDIVEYLDATRLIHSKGANSESAEFVEYLLELAKESTGLDIDFRQTSSSIVTHQAVKLDDKWYIVWDNALVRICSDILYAFGNYHLAGQLPQDVARRDGCSAFASSICRRAYLEYFANKLSDFPYVSASFAMLASENVDGSDLLNEPGRWNTAGREFISKVLHLQKLTMFFHELSHVIFDIRPDFHTTCLAVVNEILTMTGEMQKAGEIYTDAAPPALRNSRELDPAAPKNIRSHFAEELACDYQAFYLACREDSRGGGYWVDALGLGVLSSQLLGSLETRPCGRI
jgi:hypothetical protein